MQHALLQQNHELRENVVDAHKQVQHREGEVQQLRNEVSSMHASLNVPSNPNATQSPSISEAWMALHRRCRADIVAGGLANAATAGTRARACRT